MKCVLLISLFTLSASFCFSQSIYTDKIIPSEFKNKLVDTDLSYTKNIKLGGTWVSVLIPKTWNEVDPKYPDSFTSISDDPKIAGVFTIIYQNLENTYLNPEEYVNNWKVQLGGRGDNGKITSVHHYKENDSEILILESTVYAPDLGQTSMLHCSYASGNSGYTINIYSNYSYFKSNKSHLKECLKSLRCK